MKGRLRIGELARLGGVSVKALRFYDEQGLLSPDHVDPQTGYRYYSIDQTGALAAITNLRRAGFSIAEISGLVAADVSPRACEAAIAAKRRELHDARLSIEDKLKLIDALAKSLRDDSAGALSGFRLTAIADQLTSSIVETVPRLGAPVTALFEKAEADVARAGARAHAAPFMIFHDPPLKKTDIRVEICIPLTHDPQADIEASDTPGSAFACAVAYAGSYARTNALYARMDEWIASAGLIPAGPLREVYHRFGADQDDYRLPAQMLARAPGDYLTELQIPVSLPQ